MNSESYSSSGTDCLLLSASPCCWLNVWRASSSSSSSLEASSAAWLERAGGTATVPSAFWIDGFWQMYSGARPRLQISSSNCNSNFALDTLTCSVSTLEIFLNQIWTTLIMAVVASVFKVGWCLISSSTALPKLDAVSPELKQTTCYAMKCGSQAKTKKHQRQKNKQQGNLTQRVRATPSSHCRQVVRRQKHFEESLKGLALNEGVQTSRIQAEGTEHIG